MNRTKNYLLSDSDRSIHKLPEDLDIETGYYLHREKLGEGGFSKVRLATHLLTGTKVAIKCMHKSKLGEDVYRVKTEIAALRKLDHENIAKLLQVIENDTHIYLVLEYCSGGELFDYIVSQSRLTESESINIIRKLLHCLGYLHANGFAHRDLKPENILFDSYHNIKLIDFGLAAHARDSVSISQLQTCCGSPAYAAPELIAGNVYSGPAVDVWSAGIILYALLVGQLPFDDDNISVLYKKIQSGKYKMPSWLSDESKNMIRSMLQVNPVKRATVQELLKSPWINEMEVTGCPYRIPIQKGRLDEELVWDLHKYFPDSTFAALRNEILTKIGYRTATYWLLKMNRNLPKSVQEPETNLLKMSKLNRSVDSILNGLKVELANKEESKCVGVKLKVNPPASERKPKLVAVKRKIVQEKNEYPPIPSKKPVGSPKGNFQNNSTVSPSRIPVPVKSPLRPVNVRNVVNSPPPLPLKKRKVTPSKLGYGFTPVKNTPKTPVKSGIPEPTPKKSLLKRILATATPSNHHSMKNPMPRDITATAAKTTKNITMTTFQDPDQCVKKLINSLAGKGIVCKQKGYMVRCSLDSKFTNELTFNLEICTYGDKCAIQRKRLKGDSWKYKKICEEILRISNQLTTTV